MTILDKNSNIILPDARTLILDLLAARGLERFTVADLVRAGALFDLSPEAVRTAIARLKREGRLKAAGRGLYAEGETPGPWRQRIDGWHAAPARRRPWDGQWLMVAARPSSMSRTDWRHSLRALDVEGFRQLPQGPWLRPDNLDQGLDACRSRLAAYGLKAQALVARLDGLDSRLAASARQLWDLPALSANRHQHMRLMQQSLARLDGRCDAVAARETLLIGRAVVRAIVRDPLLPVEWGEEPPLEDMVAAMQAYARFGRQAWRATLADTA